MAYRSTHTGPQIDAGVDLALNPDTVPTSGSDALVTSDAVATVQAGLAPFENGATSSDDYAVGDLLVRAGILYRAKTAIAVGDAFTVDTNIEVATIAEVLENFNPGPDPYASDPAMDGTPSPGSSGDFARGDHVHPHDTSIQQISAPTLTSPASENIAAGKYRVYNNLLYKVTTAITSGETASSFASKLEAVPDGGLNDLKGAFKQWTIAQWTPLLSTPVSDRNIYMKTANTIIIIFQFNPNTTYAGSSGYAVVDNMEQTFGCAFPFDTTLSVPVLAWNPNNSLYSASMSVNKKNDGTHSLEFYNNNPNVSIGSVHRIFGQMVLAIN